jgi:hypothetical protein
MMSTKYKTATRLIPFPSSPTRETRRPGQEAQPGGGAHTLPIADERIAITPKWAPAFIAALGWMSCYRVDLAHPVTKTAVEVDGASHRTPRRRSLTKQGGSRMPHSHTRLALALVVVTGILVGMTGRGHAQFVLYDDFTAPAIDPDKWTGISTEGSLVAPATEASRAIANGGLLLNLVSFGGKTSDAGTVLTREGLNITQLGTPGGSGSINGLRTNVTVLAAKAQDCATNPAVGAPSTRAQLIGAFFNDGAGSVGNRTGDIIVIFNVQKDQGGVNRLVASVNRCPDAACAASSPITTLAGNPATFTTTWTLNTPVALRLVWDDVSGAFKFTANAGTPGAEMKVISYAGIVTESGPPIADFKSVRILNVAENCNGTRKRTSMTVLFDDVMVRRQP